MIHERDIRMELGKFKDTIEREWGSGSRDGNRDSQCKLVGGLTGLMKGMGTWEGEIWLG